MKSKNKRVAKPSRPNQVYADSASLTVKNAEALLDFSLKEQRRARRVVRVRMSISDARVMSRKLHGRLYKDKAKSKNGRGTTSWSSARMLLKHAGKWTGDDLNEQLGEVYRARSKARF